MLSLKLIYPFLLKFRVHLITYIRSVLHIYLQHGLIKDVSHITKPQINIKNLYYLF